MSRSVRQDFGKLQNMLRERQESNTAKVIQFHKTSTTAKISDEQLFTLMALSDSRYEQKARKTVVAPTAEDWAKYHLAKRALLTLKAYENTTGAEEVEIPCPKPTTHYEFLETIEEWLDRCRALRAETEQEAA